MRIYSFVIIKPPIRLLSLHCVRRSGRQMSLPFSFPFSFQRQRPVSRLFVIGARAGATGRRGAAFRCPQTPEVGRRRRRDVICASGRGIGGGVAKKSDSTSGHVPVGQRKRGYGSVPRPSHYLVVSVRSRRVR